MGLSVWERHKFRVSRREKVDATCARGLVVMASQASVLSGSWFDQDDQSRLSSRLKRTLVLSLVLHVVVLLVAVGLRLPQKGERPFDVCGSVVGQSADACEASRAGEADRVSKSFRLEAGPCPIGQGRGPQGNSCCRASNGREKKGHAAGSSASAGCAEVWRFEPRNKIGGSAPTGGEAARYPSVPDVAQDPVAKIPQRSSVSDDLNRELDEELKKIKQFQPAAKLDIPKEVKPSEASVKPVPQQEVKVPAVKTPETTLKISGTAGSSPYWARVQSIISSHWEPPPIDMAGQTYTMIVKFRLQRDGTIKDVVVQQSSGNAYYDMAGQRAVLRPRVLPAFPADMTDGYKDVEMVFRVGESVG